MRVDSVQRYNTGLSITIELLKLLSGVCSVPFARQLPFQLDVELEPATRRLPPEQGLPPERHRETSLRAP